MRMKQKADYFFKNWGFLLPSQLLSVSRYSELKSKELHKTHPLTAQASFHITQMRADTLAGASTCGSAHAAGSVRMAPTQPEHRHADRKAANGRQRWDGGCGDVKTRYGGEKEWFVVESERNTEWREKKQKKTEVSGRKMKRISSETQAAWSNTSSHHCSRQHWLPVRCLQPKPRVSWVCLLHRLETHYTLLSEQTKAPPRAAVIQERERFGSSEEEFTRALPKIKSSCSWVGLYVWIPLWAPWTRQSFFPLCSRSFHVLFLLHLVICSVT